MSSERLKEILTETVRAQMSGAKTSAIPAGGAMIWEWFLDLCRTRTASGTGLNPISYKEMESYFRLKGIDPSWRHIEALLTMDEAALSHIHVGLKQLPEGTKVIPPISKRTLSASLFDAISG